MAPSTSRSLASKTEQRKLHSMYSAKEKTNGSIFRTLVTLAINIAIIYYILGLEKDKCKCVRDWRHDYIKYYTAVVIAINVLFLVSDFKLRIFISGLAGNSIFFKVIVVIGLAILTAIGVQIYSIFTYVGDLNKTKCTCATEDMRTLNRVMLVLRWFYIIGASVISLWLLVILGRVALGLAY